MSRAFDSLAAKINSLSEARCENQMYVWPGFDPMNPNPGKFFKKLGIKFDGDLFISYPVKLTFSPLSKEELIHQERLLGIELPLDYKRLLQQFGPVHLPGEANMIIESPQEALETTRGKWCYEGKPLSVLAISSYNRTSDGKTSALSERASHLGPKSTNSITNWSTTETTPTSGRERPATPSPSFYWSILMARLNSEQSHAPDRRSGRIA